MSAHPVQDVLDRYAPAVDEEFVASALERGLHLSASLRAATASAHDREVAISRSGLPLEEQRAVRETLADPEALGRLRVEVAARGVAWSATALGQSEVMRRLGLRSASGLSRRLSEGRLYAVTAGPGAVRLFPAWQFTSLGDGRLATLPHLDELTGPAAHLHPATVAAVMTGAHDELEGRTARQWLLDGAAARPVVDLLLAQSAW